jgi:2-dehydro-3-deoxygalactonokinase
MKLFFSCDWGTSAFRLRLVDAGTLNVLSEIKTDHGIASTFESWKLINQPEEKRIAFYQTYLFEQVKKVSSSFSQSFHDAPVILSGMASSSIGMLELPYKELPFLCNGADLVVHTLLTADDNAPHEIILVSGVRTHEDAMRGEETMLVGCNISNDDGEQLFIFPGTHSKHVIVSKGLVQSITTYMTGEIFDLLSTKSILAASVKKEDAEQTGLNRFFADGVMDGKATSNLLNSIFHVRTNQLFKKATVEENYHYLSGLLIGHELKGAAENKLSPVILVCSEGLKKNYMEALTILGLNDDLQCINADDALISGQWKIMQQAG